MLLDICAEHWTFPSSCTIFDGLVEVENSRVRIDAYYSFWEGTYCDKDVYVLSFNAHSKDKRKVKDIRVCYCMSSSFMDILRCLPI